jgi:hypothetical protein
LADVRVADYDARQSSSAELFLPARYFWPFELALALLLAVWAGRWWDAKHRNGARHAMPTVDVTEGRL